MKYLKKINESKEATEQDIKDCFNDIIDYGFRVVVFIKGKTSFMNIIKNTRSWGGVFKIEEIQETLLFALPYLQSEYNIHFSNINVDGVYTFAGPKRSALALVNELIQSTQGKYIYNITISMEL